MSVVLVYAIVLLLAVLVSDLARRSILSTSVLFLAAGTLVSFLGWLPVTPEQPAVRYLAELALVSVLFTDALLTGARDLLTAWQLPGRALLLGMPLTLLITALLAHWLARLNWPEAFLIGAILSPTDPVFASAIVGSEVVPARLRTLLNVESGVNDGIAAPIVVLTLAWVAGGPIHIVPIGKELALGIVLGIAVPWLALALERSRFFAAVGVYRRIFGVAILLLVWSLSSVLHANTYLAAFAAGVTVATVGPDIREEFHGPGERLAEMLKLAALLLFGALISPRLLATIHWTGYLFALLALVLARPLAILAALTGSALDWKEKITAAWFGPKGFASVVFALTALVAQPNRAQYLFQLVALTVALSIVLHSSTDVVVAKWFGAATPDDA